MRPGTDSRKARQISAEEAAGLVRSGDWVEYFSSFVQPDVFDRALAGRKDALRGVKIRNALSLKPRAVLEADPTGEHFRCFNWHFSGYDRRKHDAGLCGYIPCNLGEVDEYYRRFIDPPAVAVLQVAPMDAEGRFNLSATGIWHRAIIERAQCVIVEVNASLPHANGPNNSVHISEVDTIIAGDNAPVPELPNPPPSDVDRAVARFIANEIEEDACLQIGIGGMPNAVCTLLLEESTARFGIHTEMLTDGLAALWRAGRAEGLKKATDPGKVIYSFAFGSRALYDTIDRNPVFECHPTEYTNPPHRIMLNDRAVAINNTTQIDLQGQAASESDGHRHISGTGGQLQFVRGAYASKGGKSFICLASTYERKGIRRSRIVLDLTPGNIVTTPRSDMMYIVTEYGIANLKGKSVAERAHAIIGLAHPDFREELERQAYENRLIPRGFF